MIDRNDPDAGRDTGDVGAGGGQGAGKSPRWKRHKDQRDEAYRMIREQNSAISRLTGLMEKFISKEAPQNQPAAKQQVEGASEMWKDYSDRELEDLRSNPTYIQEKPEIVAAANAELLERRVNRKMSDTRRDLEGRQTALIEQERRVDQVENYLLQKYGEDIADDSSDFRQLYEAQLQGFRVRSQNDNIDKERPELKIAAASLVADKLGWAPRGGEEGGTPPLDEKTTRSGSPPSPSPSDIPEGLSDTAPGAGGETGGLPDPKKEGTRKYSESLVAELFPDKVGGG